MNLSSEHWHHVHDFCILEILSRNPSHNIIEVALEITYGLPPEYYHDGITPEMLSKLWATPFDWVRLVELLTSNQFRALESLRLKW